MLPALANWNKYSLKVFILGSEKTTQVKVVVYAQNQECASLLVQSGFNYVGSSHPPLLFIIKWVIVSVTIASQTQGCIAAIYPGQPSASRVCCF